MTTVDERPKDTEPTDEARSTRRMLTALLVLLGLLVLALLVALLWLLWPQPSEGAEGITSGCPMDIQGTVEGYGAEVGETLVQPLAAALDARGDVWVSDTGNARVLVLTPDGKLVRAVGDQAGPGRLHSPNGLVVDEATDRVYVADWTRGEVVVFSGQGRYVASIPAPEQDRSVFGQHGFSPFDVDLRDGHVVTASNDGIYVFDREGLLVERWGGEGRGSAPDAFDFPNSVAVDPETGGVYVADTLNRRVVALDEEGGIRWLSGLPDEGGSLAGFWQLPRSVAVGPEGNVYVVDTFRFQEDCSGTGHVVVLSPEGELLSEFWAAGPEPAQLHFPEKLGIAGDRFVLADREKGRVIIFELTHLPPAEATEVDAYGRSFSRLQEVAD